VGFDPDIGFHREVIARSMAMGCRGRLHQGQGLVPRRRRPAEIDCDMRAFLGKAHRNRATDALRGAGHQCVMSGEARRAYGRRGGWLHASTPRMISSVIGCNDACPDDKAVGTLLSLPALPSPGTRA